MSEAKFEYIKSGTVDPRSPLIVPENPEVDSIYIQQTPDGNGIVAVWMWNHETRKYGKQ